MDIAITTAPPTPPPTSLTSLTPPTAQNVNSIHNIFCNFTVNLRPGRRLRQEARPGHVFCCENIYTASSQHGPGTYQRVSHKPFQCHTHTVTSTLKVAHPKHTERTATVITGRALRAAHPQCSIYRRRVIIAKQKQKRARKGLTNQRYRTSIRTMSSLQLRRAEGGSNSGWSDLISGC